MIEGAQARQNGSKLIAIRHPEFPVSRPPPLAAHSAPNEGQSSTLQTTDWPWMSAALCCHYVDAASCNCSRPRILVAIPVLLVIAEGRFIEGPSYKPLPAAAGT